MTLAVVCRMDCPGHKSRENWETSMDAVGIIQVKDGGGLGLGRAGRSGFGRWS